MISVIGSISSSSSSNSSLVLLTCSIMCLYLLLRNNRDTAESTLKVMCLAISNNNVFISYTKIIFNVCMCQCKCRILQGYIFLQLWFSQSVQVPCDDQLSNASSLLFYSLLSFIICLGFPSRCTDLHVLFVATWGSHCPFKYTVVTSTKSICLTSRTSNRPFFFAAH